MRVGGRGDGRVKTSIPFPGESSSLSVFSVEKPSEREKEPGPFGVRFKEGSKSLQAVGASGAVIGIHKVKGKETARAVCKFTEQRLELCEREFGLTFFASRMSGRDQTTQESIAGAISGKQGQRWKTVSEREFGSDEKVKVLERSRSRPRARHPVDSVAIREGEACVAESMGGLDEFTGVRRPFEKGERRLGPELDEAGKGLRHTCLGYA